jgi:hypothetical protein
VTKTITFNGTVYACPYIDALPPLSPEERSELDWHRCEELKPGHPNPIATMFEECRK